MMCHADPIFPHMRRFLYTGIISLYSDYRSHSGFHGMPHTTIQEKVMKKKPKQQTGFSEKGIGEAIKEGAVTK